MSGSSLALSLHLRDGCTLMLLINLLEHLPMMARWLWCWVTDEADSEGDQTSTEMLQRPAGLGWFALVWWMDTRGVQPVCLSAQQPNSPAQHSQYLATVIACMCVGCFSNNRECRDWRSTLVKCVSLCQ